MKPIPKFESEDEEREFWATHDSADHVDWSRARRVSFPELKPSTRTISLRLPETLLITDDMQMQGLQKALGTAAATILGWWLALRRIAVALEVLDSYYDGPGQDYHAVGAFTRDDRLLGYACWGASPCTRGTWDLYWIAVSPDAQGRGIGTLIMQEVERRLTRADARLVLIETSSTEPYAPTRAFYEARGYTEVARVPDFYLDGDDRVILARRLDGRSAERRTRES
mgnify:CR=1 FL=1